MKIFSRPTGSTRRLLLLVVLTALIINAGTWALLRWRIPPTEELIPLHYTIYFGIDRLGSWGTLFLIPLSGLAILIVNGVGAFLVRRRDPFLGALLLTVALLVQIIIAIAAVVLVALNITA